MLKDIKDFLRLPENCFVLFSTPHCAPCKIIKPLIEQSPTEVILINPEEYVGLANKFNVAAVPTLVKVVNGKLSNAIVGKQPPDVLNKFLS